MHLRKKLVAAAALLLVCAVLLVSVSYAWFSISSVPEISGIETNIGANGSLEIALLSDTTYTDPSLIRTAIGDSLVVQDSLISNTTWGNVIDLRDPSYGLDQISMLPSRLNVTQGGQEYGMVSSNMLIYPRYGLDGRSSDFYQDSVSAVYSDNAFTYSTQQQNYGVRAIGTTSEMAVQQAALAGARSRVYSYTSAASSTAASAWKADGEAFLDIYIRHYYLDTETFTKSDVGVIRDMAVRMHTANNYVDLALRQGLVGYAASMIEDEDTFKYARTALENPSIPLIATLNAAALDVPTTFNTWATVIYQDSVVLKGIADSCDSLYSSKYSEFTWSQINMLLDPLMSAEHTYWGDVPLTKMNFISSDNVLTLTKNAGPMAHIADFAGNYSTFISYLDEASIEVTTLSSVGTPYLVQISNTLDGLQAATGDNALTRVPLEDIYGFSVDLAFRSNHLTNLLLQTTPAAKIEGTDDYIETQGSGSYMHFHSETLTGEEISRMMDAIRVGFLDNQNRLIALAKCSSYTKGDMDTKADLYLHEFSVTEDGSVSVGAPLVDRSAVTTLTEGVPTVLTVVVWLDGDYVDNSMAAISGRSIYGELNLQFASSVNLLAADLELDEVTVG